MNRVQNRLEDEQMEQIYIQSSYEDFCCHFADHKTLQLRPASTHEMTGTSTREYESTRQRMKAMLSHLVVMQHDENSLNEEALKNFVY